MENNKNMSMKLFDIVDSAILEKATNQNKKKKMNEYENEKNETKRKKGT